MAIIPLLSQEATMARILSVPENPCHVRSISEPSTSHPLLATVKEELNKLKDWKASSTSPSSLTAELLCNGLHGLKGLYDCTEDVLQPPLVLPQTKKLGEDALDESVRLLDACNKTREILLQTREHAQDLQSALRRKCAESYTKDNIKNYISSMKMVKKDICKCLCELQRMETRCTSSIDVDQDQHLSTVARLLRETKLMTIYFLQIILLFISSSRPKAKASKWSLVSRLVQKRHVAFIDEDQKNMHEKESLEIALCALLGCISAQDKEMERAGVARKQLVVFETTIERLEGGLDCMFKCLIQARVSLLNLPSR